MIVLIQRILTDFQVFLSIEKEIVLPACTTVFITITTRERVMTHCRVYGSCSSKTILSPSLASTTDPLEDTCPKADDSSPEIRIFVGKTQHRPSSYEGSEGGKCELRPLENPPSRSLSMWSGWQTISFDVSSKLEQDHSYPSIRIGVPKIMNKN
jgi:hypothetical protein